MGDTILGNVIVLALSFFFGVLSLTVSLSGISGKRDSGVVYAIAFSNLCVLVLIGVLFYTGNVASGYGP